VFVLRAKDEPNRSSAFRQSVHRLGQRVASGIDGVLAELLLDAQELVGFCQTIGAAKGAGLDLAAVRRLGFSNRTATSTVNSGKQPA
jgi:hypothetical protein